MGWFFYLKNCLSKALRNKRYFCNHEQSKNRVGANELYSQ